MKKTNEKLDELKKDSVNFNLLMKKVREERLKGYMKRLLKDLKNGIYGIILLALLTACGISDDRSVETEQAQAKKTEQKDQVEKSETKVPKPPVSFKDYDDYINYISRVPGFEPYYQTAFDFDMLSDGIASVPIEEVKAMYDEMKTVFDYVLVGENPLLYRGNYEGETSFVDGIEQTENLDISDVVNVASYDWEGNEILTTPLKTILLGESIFKQFDDDIEEGRNLQMSDFTLKAPNKPIHVVLGSAYKDIYKIGDIFPLEFISKVMDFQVVGFYKPGTEFSMEVGALQHVNFDHTIVMPHFIPDYEPVDEAAIFQHAFHIAELTSGYIKISEAIENINDESYDHTALLLEEMAEKHKLPNHYKIGYWPVGFVW